MVGVHSTDGEHENMDPSRDDIYWIWLLYNIVCSYNAFVVLLGFRDEYEKISNAGFHVFALSGDSPKALTSWKMKQMLPYGLLSDPEHKLIKQFGSSKPGKKIQRSHVVVAKGGVVADVQAQVSPQESVERAIAFCCVAT